MDVYIRKTDGDRISLRNVTSIKESGCLTIIQYEIYEKKCPRWIETNKIESISTESD